MNKNETIQSLRDELLQSQLAHKAAVETLIMAQQVRASLERQVRALGRLHAQRDPKGVSEVAEYTELEIAAAAAQFEHPDGTPFEDEIRDEHG